VKGDKTIVRLWREGNLLRIAFGDVRMSRDIAGKSKEEVDRIIEETKAVVRSCGEADA